MQDINTPNVEVKIREDKKVLWVNTEEGCILRVSGIENLTLDAPAPLYESPLVIYEVTAIRKDFLMMQVPMGCYRDKKRAESIVKGIIETGKLPGWFVALPENNSYKRYTDFTAHLKKITVREADDGIFDHEVEPV